MEDNMEENKIEENIHEEGKVTKKIRRNPWVVSTFVLGILCLILLVGMFVQENSETKNDICSQISATPSWIKDNQLIGRGFTTFNNSNPNLILEQLINDNVFLVYSNSCSACKMQIQYFGDSWNKYVDSGLTIKC